MIKKDLVRYLSGSPTSVHAVATTCAMLESAGFERIEETAQAGSLPAAFYMVRGGALAAARRGTGQGFRIACAHTDFPGLVLKPNPLRTASGYTTALVEIYGSPILATWFDRDLALAGVAVRRAGGGVVPFRLPGVFGRISTPAIHLNRGVNEEGLQFNKEDNLPPLISTGEYGPDVLEEAICAAAGMTRRDLSGWSARLVDAQPPAVTGPKGEFVTGSGIDDLAMCHAVSTAIAAASGGPQTSVALLFDSEEVGSGTPSGAMSDFAVRLLEKLAGGREELQGQASRSIIISADGAHALHPCWEGRHDRANRPVLNGGPVIKSNAQARYSTTAETAAYFRECAQAAGVPVQYFACRNDIPCGGTIGPMLSTRLGMRAVDAGTPMLSMHSVRECAGTVDQTSMIAVLQEHYAGTVPVS